MSLLAVSARKELLSGLRREADVHRLAWELIGIEVQRAGSDPIAGFSLERARPLRVRNMQLVA